LSKDESARAFKGLAAAVLALALAGCAGNANSDPGATALSAGETCPSIRSDLSRLDKEGVPALVERQNAGQKLSAAQKAKADLYNRLLDKYLGARCHV
jgi:hypothetical protein